MLHQSQGAVAGEQMETSISGEPLGREERGEPPAPVPRRKRGRESLPEGEDAATEG